MINHPNRATLYTVLRPSGEVEDRGLTTTEAAAVILNYDGQTYDVQSAAAKYDVGEEAQFVLYSRRQGGRWTQVSSIKGVYAQSAQAAWPLLAREVLRECGNWRGQPSVMTDADFDAMQAEQGGE